MIESYFVVILIFQSFVNFKERLDFLLVVLCVGEEGKFFVKGELLYGYQFEKENILICFFFLIYFVIFKGK